MFKEVRKALIRFSRRKEGIRMNGRAAIFFIVLSFVAVLFGCAESRIYLMDIEYIQGEEAPPTSKTVGICPFQDAREEKEKDTIGTRYRFRDRVDHIKLKKGTLSESVTQAVKDYFVERGFEVTDCKGWDKTAEGLDRMPKDLSLVVGGKIDSFMVEARSGVTVTETSYTVKMDAFIGQVEKRNLVIRSIESAPRFKKISFDMEEVRAQLDSTLTEVIQKLFEGKY
jgi:hypothetical protein